MAVQGDITEVTYNNADVGSGTFKPKANEGNTFDIGGIRSNDDASMITSDGTLIDQKNRVRGFLEVVVEDDAANREDLLNMTLITESTNSTDFTFTTIGGQTFAGKGIIVGDLQKDLNTGMVTVKIAPRGKWKKIAG